MELPLESGGDGGAGIRGGDAEFHGSPGYGQKFTEEISKDWGGEVYTDIMDGVDAAIAKYPFIDGSRMAAAGASYGGFMIDWIATHTGRFKCMMSHAGPYDARSMYGSTEELWFMEWEYGGTPWANPELYDKWSSEKNAGALGKFKTPTLVIGGELRFSRALHAGPGIFHGAAAAGRAIEAGDFPG